MKANKILFFLSCVLYSLPALSLIIAVAGDYNGNKYAVFAAILAASVFWGCLALATVLLIIVNHRRKKDNYQVKDRIKLLRRIGALRFFSNRPAAIFDILMVILFIATAVTMFIPAVSDFVSLVLAVLLFISIDMHCMLNGINFIYINSYKTNK